MALGVGAQLSGDDTGLGEVLRGTVELAQSQGDVAHVAQHVRHLFVVAHLPWASAASCTARSSRLCSSSTAATCSCSSAAAVCRWAVLIFGERHLRQVLAGYAAHYNTAKRDCRFRRGRARRRTDAGVANMQLSEPPYSTVPSSRRGVSSRVTDNRAPVACEGYPAKSCYQLRLARALYPSLKAGPQSVSGHDLGFVACRGLGDGRVVLGGQGFQQGRLGVPAQRAEPPDVLGEPVVVHNAPVFGPVGPHDVVVGQVLELWPVPGLPRRR